MAKSQDEIAKPKPKKALAKHRKLSKEELNGLKCTAPEGKKELAPGKSFCIGPRNFKSAIFSIQADKDGNEKLVRNRVKFSCVPDKMLKGVKVKDGTFLGK